MYSKLCNEKFEEITEDYEIQELNILKFVRQGKGHCFNYALKDYDLRCVEDSFDILEIDYKIIPLSQAKKGDIISLHDLENIDYYINGDNVKHFAVIINSNRNINDIIVRSKWGNLGIYEGKLRDLPLFYGATVVIWRKKQFAIIEVKK